MLAWFDVLYAFAPTVYPFMQKTLCFLQMSAISAQQMQALDMNSVCMGVGVGCFMHVYVVHRPFDVVKILPRFNSKKREC